MSDELSRQERETARRAGEVARRAIRRLDVLEWVLIGAALFVAILGGAVVAWLLARSGGTAFRVTWMVSALLLFVVPGAVVILQGRRAERRRSDPSGRTEREDG